MAKLLSLFQYHGEDQKDFSPYLVFRCSDKKKLYSLSPDIMKIQGDLYVADLLMVKKYWQKRAELKQQDFQDYFEKELQKKLSSSSPLVLCNHPFQGLIFFNHLEARQAQGLYKTHSLF